VYVNADWASVPVGTDPNGRGCGGVIGSDTFAKVQDAINAVNAGGTVLVMEGTYAENLVITKALTLRGPNYGVSPNGNARQPEARIVPATGAVTTALYSRVIAVSASDVTIDGFLIDGDNTSLTSGILGTNSADIDARVGIENSAGVNNLHIKNNIVQNLLFTAVRFQSTSGLSVAVSSGHLLEANLLRDVGTYQTAGGFEKNGSGVIIQNSHYVLVRSNVIENVRIGIQTNNIRLASATTDDYGIRENLIGARAIGVSVNSQLTSPWKIENNTIQAVNHISELGLGTIWRGIQVLNTTAGIGSTVLTANIIRGETLDFISSEGISVWNVPQTARVDVIGGQISGTSIGVHVNNYNGNNFNATRGAHAMLHGVTIDARSVGIKVFDSPRSTHAPVNVTLEDGVLIRNGTQGLSIVNASASVAEIQNITFTGQLASYIELIGNATDLDATHATFDGVNASNAPTTALFAIEDKLLHKQDTVDLGLIRIKAGALYTTVSGSIQRSIDNATAGDIIYVQDGQYATLLNIHKSVVLAGPNAGREGADGARDPEARIVPPLGMVPTGAGLDSGNALVTVSAPGVVIDGMHISGFNSASGDSSYSANAANLQVDTGISVVAPQVTIQNSVVQNTLQYGIVLSASAATSMYGTVVNNVVENAAWYSGISARNNYYGNISNNTIRDSWRGIETFNHTLPAPVGSEIEVTNNTITLHTVSVGGDATYTNVNGILHHQQMSGASQWSFNGNTIINSDSVTASAGSIGIELADVAMATSLSENSITGFAVGYQTWNITSGDVGISGGSVSGAGVGLVATNYDASWGNAENSFVTVSDVAVGATTIGVQLVDHPSNTNGATSKVTLADGTSIAGGDTGLWLDGNDVILDAQSGTELSGQSGAYIVLRGHSGNVDATRITFSGVAGDSATLAQQFVIEDKLTHAPDQLGVGLVRVKQSQVFVTASGSIQRGISAASVGDVVHVGAGTYPETITVSKAVELRGPNYGINPNTGTRVTEAVIVPATTNTDSASIGSNMVTIAASGVVIDGLKIDGDNPSLAESMVGFVGSEHMSMDAARGVYVSSNGLNNIRVANNVVQNVSSAGIRFQQATNYFASNGSSVYSSSNVIDGNRVQNIGSLGIDVRNSMYTAITNNVVNNARYGIYVNSFRISNQAGSEYQEIAGNTITARQMGIWMNLYAAEPFTIRNNSISAVNTGEFTKWYGVMLSTISTPQNMVNQAALPLVLTPERWSLSNNNIIGSGAASSTTGYGYWLWSVDNNQTSNGTANVGAISGGTVSNVDVGLFMHNVDTDAATNYGIARTGAHASIANVTMNVNTDGTGIQIKDSPNWATANIAPLVAKRNVKLIVGSGVTVNGGANGLVLEEAFASVDTASGMAFNGQSGTYVKLVNNTGAIDATAARFDGVTGTTGTVAQNLNIEDKISHKSDNAALGLVRITAGNIYVTTQSGSIQRGVDIAAVGDAVTVGAGTYQENVVINKQIKLVGAGSSSGGTGISAADTSLPVISIIGSGVDATNQLVVRGFRSVGNNPSGGSDAIVIQPTSSASYITVDDVNISSHGVAVHYRSGTLRGMTVKNSTLSGNGNGLRVASAVSGLDGLTVDDVTMDNSLSSALNINPSGPSNPNLTNFTITNSRFTNNSTAGVANQHDLSFYAFRGNATLRNVQLTAGNGSRANAYAHGIVFTNAPNESVPAGNIVLDNVTVAGHVGKSALTFQYYSDVTGIQLSDVDLRTVVAPWGDLTVYTSAGTTLALNDTKLKSAATWSAGGIDATTAQFVTMAGTALNRSLQADLFTMADQVGDAVDMAGIGLVRLVPNTVYVTTLSGSIQRGVNAANVGDTITVAPGAYQENVVIDKQVILAGSGSGSTITATDTNLPVISVTGSGVDASMPLSISGFKITGASNSGGSDGIAVQPTNPASHIVIADVSLTNLGQAIHYRSGTLTDMTVRNVILEENNFGLRVASAVSGLNGLNIDTATMNNNTSSAITINPSGPSNPNVTNITITNSRFANNSTAGVANQHDLSFYAFRGNATLRNVQVTAGNGSRANGSSHGIVFTNTPNESVPAGNIVLDNVTVAGHVGKSALTFQYYSDVSGIQMTGVDLGAVVAPWGDLTVYTSAGTTLAINDTKLESVVTWAAGGVDATSAQFVTSAGTPLNRSVRADLFTMANQIGDAVDVVGLGMVRLVPNNLFVTTLSGSIQRAVDLATTGEVVNVGPGIYNENVVLAKHIELAGAGSGTDGTIINALNTSLPVITITGSGSEANNPLVVRGIRSVGASPTGGSDAIAIKPTTTARYITISDVHISSHGVAVHYRTGTLLGMTVQNSTLNGNGNGVRVASAVVGMDGLTVSGSTIDNNVSIALSINPSGPSNPNLTNITVADTTFSNNSTAGIQNQHDLSFYGFRGNATLRNVTVTAGNGSRANANSNAVLFTNAPGTYAPLGNVILDNLTVRGFVGKSALSFQAYTDVSGVSMQGVDLSATVAPWGDLVVEAMGGRPLAVNDTKLKSIVLWGTGSVDATSARFIKIDGTALNRNIPADNFSIADQVVDAIDFTGLGLVRTSASSLYVTTRSFFAPATLNGALERALTQASANDTIVVENGVPVVLTAPITKDVTFSGTFVLKAANLPSDATQSVAVVKSFVDRAGSSSVSLAAVVVTNNGTVTGYFDAIQPAISSATTLASSVLTVAPGTYAEALTINKPLTLRGPNAGLNGTTTRGPEAIIVPATADADNNVLVTLAASNITIDGFTLDGDNPTLPSNGLGYNGADQHASEGISSSSDAVSGTIIANNIMTNLAFSGVNLYGVSGNVAKTGHVVRDNLIKDLGHYSASASSSANWGIGVLLYNSNYTAVRDNTLQNVRIGIQTGNYQTANTGDAAHQVISGNSITARSKGIFYNLHNYSPWTVRDNNISGVTSSDEAAIPSATNSARGYWTGILVASQGASAPSTLSNNAIDGSAIIGMPTAGITVWNVKSTAAAQISGGSITGVQTGIGLNNYEGYRNDATYGAHASVSNVPIAATQIGIDVRDSASSTAHAAVALSVGSGVDLTGGTDGIVLTNAAATVSNLNTTVMSGQSGSYVKLVNNTGTVDATAVSFEGVTGATGTVTQNLAIEDKITHKSDNVALGLVRVNAGNIYVTTQSGSIQRGIDIAAAGDVVTVGAGSYQANLVINKQIKLVGAGSSTTGTVVTAASGSLPIISVTGSGIDAANPLSIDGFKITGAAYSGGSDGIAIQPTNPAAHIAIRNVAINNQGQAIHYRSGTLTDMSVSNVTLEGNSFGLRVASAVVGLNGLSIDGATVNNNVSSALSINPSGPSNPNLTNFSITNSTFTNNSTAGVVNQHDLSFYAFRGNATLRNVVVTSGNGTRANANAYGIVFTNAPATYAPSGSITLDNVKVQGFVGKAALSFQKYSDVSGIRLQNVDLRSVVAPWGDLVVDTSGTTPLAANDTQLKSIVLWGPGSVDATTAQFVSTTGTALNRSTLADNFIIANQVYDAVDYTGLGLVRTVPDNIYVTALSGSIQRGVDAATVGDTVNVSAGTYSGSVNLGKSIKLVGEAVATTIINGNGSNGLNITGDGASAVDRLEVRDLTITGSARGVNVSNNADFISIDGVLLTGNTATGLSIDTQNTSDDIVVQNSSFINNGVGIKVHSTGVATNVRIEDNTFSGNANGGFYSGDANASFAPSNLSNFILRNNAFTENGTSNNSAGVYIERLQNGAIEGNTFTDNGVSSNPRGLVLNLKHQRYTDIAIAQNQFRETRNADALAGFGMSIAARDDASYASAPATLADVNVTENELTGFYSGIIIDNNVDLDSFTLDNNMLSGGVVSIHTAGSAHGTLAMRNNSITGASAYLIMNEAAGVVDARQNWFGTPFVEFFEPLLLGQVDYDPTLENGNDTSSAIGFQR
jgi:hypothetical protein